jgi:hypothetical protein
MPCAIGRTCSPQRVTSFVEHRADAALDEVARRAGVGIATLYCRFPDREALQRAGALDGAGAGG